MARLSIVAMIAFVLLPLTSILVVVQAAPVPVLRGSSLDVVKRSNGTTFVAGSFVQQAYNDFQISDGVGGNASQQAAAVFLTPFAGVDLSTVDEDTLNAVNAMAEEAVDAEDAAFDPAIAAASGAAADALQVGKIKNKVLKLTGEVQVLNIKIAQAAAKGASTSDLESQLATEQTKLTKDTADDVASAGQASQGVSFTGQ